MQNKLCKHKLGTENRIQVIIRSNIRTILRPEMNVF